MEYLSFGFLDRFKTSTYVPVSSATLLIYDTLLTFPDEIRYVWGSTWSVGKCLYILSRYPILLNSIVQFHNMYIFGAVAAEAMGIALFAVFDLQVGEIFVPRDVIQSLSYPGCVFVSSKSSDHAIASYVVLMAYECGIFALMIVNGVVNHLSFPSSSSLMYNFYKDGFMYFLTLIVASVINLIITVTQPVRLALGYD
ncbi:hypothetical protein ONZ45_g5411 [Pleurotus djamor]|nr:hypothetical protein ONZ45_g5411 [Pleurotus djamor]